VPGSEATFRCFINLRFRTLEKQFFSFHPSSHFVSLICVCWPPLCHSLQRLARLLLLLNLFSRNDKSRLFHRGISRHSNRIVSTLLLPSASPLFSRHGHAEVCEGFWPWWFPSHLTLTAANCNANSGFQPIAAGGDGAVVQFCTYL
jgi:hypothetical protein